MRAVFAWAAVLALAPIAAQAAEIAGTATVIDGDTIEIHGTRIRLHGIDAPESRQSCRRADRAWRCGQQAALAVSDFIGRRTVRCDPRDRDRYGRVVAVCYVAGVDLNAWMVRQGWALAYRRYSRDYVPAEAEAAHDRAGIWAGSFISPWEWRRSRRR